MKTINFCNGNVGIELESVSEIIKFNAIGDKFCICNIEEDYYDEDIEETDQEGNIIERAPTKKEILDRILEAFKNGEKMYATFWLDCGKIVPNKATTIQSDFYIGQEVYFMQKIKIVKGEIRYLNLVSTQNKQGFIVDNKAQGIAQRLYNLVAAKLKPFGYPNFYEFNSRHELEQEVKSAFNDNMAVVKLGSNHVSCNFKEIYASKEDLIKHLMEEDNC